MQEPNGAIEIGDRLAVELKDYSQYSVGGRMLRAHIEHHLLGVEESFLCVCCRLFLHIVVGDGGWNPAPNPQHLSPIVFPRTSHQSSSCRNRSRDSRDAYRSTRCLDT